MFKRRNGKRTPNCLYIYFYAYMINLKYSHILFFKRSGQWFTSACCCQRFFVLISGAFGLTNCPLLGCFGLNTTNISQGYSSTLKLTKTKVNIVNIPFVGLFVLHFRKNYKNSFNLLFLNIIVHCPCFY